MMTFRTRGFARLCLAPAFLALVWCFAAPARAQTLIVVRHAEAAGKKADDPLLDEGIVRRKALADVLASAGVNKVLVSDHLRTQQTAKALADRAGLKLDDRVDHNAGEGELFKHIDAGLAKGDVMLVVHHSHSIPSLLASLGYPGLTTPEILNREWDHLWIFVRDPQEKAKWTMVHLRYGPPSCPAPAPAGPPVAPAPSLVMPGPALK